MINKQGVYLVTGASSGIGQAVANLLIKQGHSLITIARRSIDFSGLGKQQTVEHIQCDLASDDIEKCVAPVLKKTPHLAGCILCHGYGDFASLEEFSAARIERLVATNLTSYLLLARLVIPQLKANKRGDIVVLGSEAALNGAQKGSVYCATKFALRGFVQSVRQECAASGVKVALVNPGMVRTPFFDNLSFLPGESQDNFLMPEDVAQTIDLILQISTGSVIDEVNLSPQKHVVKHK